MNEEKEYLIGETVLIKDLSLFGYRYAETIDATCYSNGIKYYKFAGSKVWRTAEEIAKKYSRMEDIQGNFPDIRNKDLNNPAH
jgi:hypothetical protein